MSNLASMTDGSFAGLGGAFAKQLAETGGCATWDGRGLRLFSGETGSEFQVKGTNGKIVTNDNLPSASTLLAGPGALQEASAASSNDRGNTGAAPADAGTAAEEKEEHETPSKRRWLELTEFDKFDAVWTNSADATAAMAKNSECGCT